MYAHIDEVREAARALRRMAGADPEDRDPQTIDFFERLTGDRATPDAVLAFCDRFDAELAEHDRAATFSQESATMSNATKTRPRVRDLGTIDVSADAAWFARLDQPRNTVSTAQAAHLQRLWNQAEEEERREARERRPVEAVAVFAAEAGRAADRLGISPARAAELRKLNEMNRGV